MNRSTLSGSGHLTSFMSTTLCSSHNKTKTMDIFRVLVCFFFVSRAWGDPKTASSLGHARRATVSGSDSVSSSSSGSFQGSGSGSGSMSFSSASPDTDYLHYYTKPDSQTNYFTPSSPDSDPSMTDSTMNEEESDPDSFFYVPPSDNDNGNDSDSNQLLVVTGEGDSDNATPDRGVDDSSSNGNSFGESGLDGDNFFNALGSDDPSLVPSQSSISSTTPSLLPSQFPSDRPSIVPSTVPSSGTWTGQGDATPTKRTSDFPSIVPTSWNNDKGFEEAGQGNVMSSDYPSLTPSSSPSGLDDVAPTQRSSLPSMAPSTQPSDLPSMQPSDAPSTQPSDFPSLQPSSLPSTQPSDFPSLKASASSAAPTSALIVAASTSPSDAPSLLPSTQPSSLDMEIRPAGSGNANTATASGSPTETAQQQQPTETFAPDSTDNSSSTARIDSTKEGLLLSGGIGVAVALVAYASYAMFMKKGTLYPKLEVAQTTTGSSLEDCSECEEPNMSPTPNATKTSVVRPLTTPEQLTFQAHEPLPTLDDSAITLVE